MAKNFIIEIELYHRALMFSYGQTDAELKKSMVRNFGGVEDPENTIFNQPEFANGRAVMLSTNDILVRVFPQLTISDRNSIIAHEVFHAVTFIMHSAGLKFKMNVSDEAYAYLIGYITKVVYQKLKDEL